MAQEDFDDLPDTHAPFRVIEEMILARKPVYMVNKARAPNGALSIIALDYHQGSQALKVSIPRSSFPFDITTLVRPATALIDCRAFQDQYESGNLALVPTEEAERILRNPEVRKSWRSSNDEANRVNKHRAAEARRERDALQKANVSSTGALEASAAVLDALQPGLSAVLRPAGATTAPAAPPSRLSILTTRVSNGSVTGDEVILEQLQNMLGDLSVNDVVSVMNGPAWPEKARQWAKKILPEVASMVGAKALP